MLSLLAAAALSLPTVNDRATAALFGNLPPKFTTRDSITIWFEALTDERGRIVDCQVRAMHGEPAMGNDLCGEFVGKRVVPARGPGGEPIAGVFRSIASVGASSLGRMPTGEVLPPELELQVNRLPDGASDTVALALLVEESGIVAGCNAADGSTGPLVTAACQQASSIDFTVRQIDGKNVAYVRPFSVKFAAASPAS